MLIDIILEYMRDKNIKYSLYIEDLQYGEVCSINEKEVVPSASIIKLFVMGKAFEAVYAGKLNLKDRIIIDNKERVPCSIINALDKENTYTLKDIITLMIIQSDNTAANQLISLLGMENIIKYIVESGFTSTFLNRRMMDFEARKRGLDNYTSAEDVARFLKLMYNGLLINMSSSDAMLEIMKMQLDNSMMRINLEDDLIIAHKTGNLAGIKHDAGIVYAGHKHYIFAMLTWGAESDSYGRQAIGSVSKAVYDYMTESPK